MKTKISLIIVLAILALSLLFTSSVLAAEKFDTSKIEAGKTYQLTGDVEVDKQLDIAVDGFTLDLNGHTITASDSYGSTYENDQHVINITGKNVTIKNGTVVTTEKTKNGINVFQTTGVVLEDLTIDNTKTKGGAPLIVNESSVEVKGTLDLKLGDKSWYGIDVGYGKNPGSGTASLDFAKGSEVTVEGGNGIALVVEQKEGSPEATVSGAKEAGLDMNESGAFVQHEHVFADKWFADAKNHWKECECGEKDAVVAHKFKEVTENGSKYQVCTVCGYKTEPVAITETTEEKDDTPKTGVSTVALSAAGVMALVSLAGIAINRKK